MRLALASLITLACVAAPAAALAQEAGDPPKTKGVDPDVEAWVKVLADRLADRNDQVRRSAEQALAALGPQAVPILKEMAEGGDDARAVLAKKAMERIRKGRVIRGALKRRAMARRMGRGPGPEKGPRTGHPPGGGGRPPMLLGRLGLTGDQKEKVREIHRTHMEEARALGEKLRSGEVDREGMRAARKELREKLKGKMKEVLTEEQYEKLERSMDRGGPGMRPGRGRGFGPGNGGGPHGRHPF